MVEDRPWLTEGARVAVYNNGSLHHRVSFATVVRITKRDVVLDSGQRYNATSLRESGNRYGRTDLRDPADPAVIETYLRQRQEQAVGKVETLLRQWRNLRPHERNDGPLTEAHRLLGRVLSVQAVDKVRNGEAETVGDAFDQMAKTLDEAEASP